MLTTLTEDQQLAFQELESWWKNPRKKEHLLSGGAGTGKTTLIGYWLNTHPEIRVSLLAPTNKAVSVLKGSIPFKADVYTIHSVLGLVIQESKHGSFKMKGSRVTKDSEQITFHTGANKFETINYSLVIVDEVSILSKEIEELLKATVLPTGAKILWVGDSCQLPPPGKKSSDVFECGSRSILEQVVRYDAGVLKIAEYLRKCIQLKSSEKPTLDYIVSHQNDLPSELLNVVLLDSDDWCQELENVVKKSTEFKILAHRNEKVCHYNSIVRNLHGIESTPFAIGEELISLRKNDYSRFVNRTNKKASFFNGEVVTILSSRSRLISLCDPFSQKEINIFNPEEVVSFVLNFSKSLNYPVEIWDTTVQSAERPLEWTIPFIDPCNNEKMIDIMNRSIILKDDLKDVTSIFYTLDSLAHGLTPKVYDASILENAEECLNYLKTLYSDSDFIQTITRLKQNCNSLYSAYKDWDSLSFMTYHWSYNYALTVYKSQGSGFDTVFIDGGDILSSPNWKKLLYVALTRAKQKVFLKR